MNVTNEVLIIPAKATSNVQTSEIYLTKWQEHFPQNRDKTWKHGNTVKDATEKLF